MQGVILSSSRINTGVDFLRVWFAGRCLTKWEKPDGLTKANIVAW